MLSKASAYLWEGLSIPTHKIAALAGQCSLLQSDSDSFMSNFAIVAGGAIYATNMTSLKLLCSSGELASSTTACDSWADNGVQVQQSGDELALQVCRSIQPYRIGQTLFATFLCRVAITMETQKVLHGWLPCFLIFLSCMHACIWYPVHLL